MSRPKTVHVTKRPDAQWQAKAEGADRPIAVTATQSTAAARGTEWLRRNGGGELVVHGVDGTIVDKRTIAPGNDPFPPRG
ncbi:DUF2188 domain-containing protein [Yinghuangia sp. YIM S09857]|uniref:DUF2188 domain-containing protein n=1 Tax=Yinghuangia sp. YIM S09857 TaxID=3436929 RepID=UPI003F534F06